MFGAAQARFDEIAKYHEVWKHIFSRVAQHTGCLATRLHLFDGIQQCAPHLHHGKVAAPEVLLGAVINGARGFYGQRILSGKVTPQARKRLGFHFFPILQVAVRSIANVAIVRTDFL